MQSQLKSLSVQLPHFRTLFEEADGNRGYYWVIVRWEGIAPQNVHPHQVQIFAEAQGSSDSQTEFAYPSPALTRSAQIARNGFTRQERTEKEHWGVWKLTQNGKTFYQSVMPVCRKVTKTASSEPEIKVSGASTLMRVSDRTHQTLRRLAEQENKTMQAVLDEAVREYDRLLFFKKANADYAALRNDPEAWAEELKERAEWDVTLMDGIDADEIWDEETGTATFRQPEAARG